VTTIIVAAAVIERDGCFLVTKRQSGVHLEGYWEFPGGKCEPGETMVACMSRELREELDIDVRVGEEILTTAHAYPDRTVELHFFACILFGAPRPQVGQEMMWASREELTRMRFPPADETLISLLLKGDSAARS
jgi:mutator protein MutT